MHLTSLLAVINMKSFDTVNWKEIQTQIWKEINFTVDHDIKWLHFRGCLERWSASYIFRLQKHTHTHKDSRKTSWGVFLRLTDTLYCMWDTCYTVAKWHIQTHYAIQLSSDKTLMNVFTIIKQTTLGLRSAMMTCRLQNSNSVINLFHPTNPILLTLSLYLRQLLWLKA